jgi:uncharacterized protein (DUF58 family)
MFLPRVGSHIQVHPTLATSLRKSATPREPFNSAMLSRSCALVLLHRGEMFSSTRDTSEMATDSRQIDRLPLTNATEVIINRLLTTDFFPGVNRYVYWLKEPIGWFVLAGFVSALVGLYLSPIGWTLAAGIAAIIAVGLAFPWLAVRTARCELRPLAGELFEHEPSVLQLSIVNRLPMPLWGLSVEGYLTGDPARTMGQMPEIALGSVAPFCKAVFRLPIVPQYRGHFPVVRPQIACGFPFGIWTARRDVEKVEPVTVWPLRVELHGETDFRGGRWAEVGDGNRTGGSSDFLGVRPFRRGDSLRSVHWVQSARQDTLIVCERAAPEAAEVKLSLDTSATRGSQEEVRDHLAWRVRIANSLLVHFHGRHLNLQFILDGKLHAVSRGSSGLQAIGGLLAEIPLMPQCERPVNACAGAAMNHQVASGPVISISPEVSRSSSRYVLLRFQFAATSLRENAVCRQYVIDLQGDDIAWQLNHALCEVGHARQVA